MLEIYYWGELASMYLPTVKFSWPERYISLESALQGLLLFQARERSYKNLMTAFLYLRLISVSYDPHSIPRSNKGVLRCKKLVKKLGNEVAPAPRKSLWAFSTPQTNLPCTMELLWMPNFRLAI
jgi:hypothetical protein